VTRSRSGVDTEHRSSILLSRAGAYHAGEIGGGMLGGWAVARIMKTHAAATGLNPDHYSGHSPRAGSCPNVTAAAAAPAP
jgi:hypothetical protein